MHRSLQWFDNLLKGMGDALFHPFRDNEPPEIGYQPFRDQPYKKRGLIWSYKKNNIILISY